MSHYLANLLRVMTALTCHRSSTEFNDGVVGELLTRFTATSRAGIYLLYDTEYRGGRVPLYQLDFESSSSCAQLYLDTHVTDPLVKIAMLGVVACASFERKQSITLSIRDNRGPFRILFESGAVTAAPPISKHAHACGLRFAILASAITVAEQLGLEPLDDELVRQLWRCGLSLSAPIGEQRVYVKWQEDVKTTLLAEIHAQGYIAYPPGIDYSYPQFLLVCATIWAMSAVEREQIFVFPNPQRYAAHLRSATVRGGVCTVKHVQRVEVTEPTN